MNKSQQVEFCLRTAIFLKREAEEAIHLHDEAADIRALFSLTQETARRCAAIRLNISLAGPADEDFLEAAPLAWEPLVDLKVALERMIVAAWPHGDERAQVARLYLRLYCVMLENPETLTAI